MDNLRAVIKSMFCHISAEQIIDEQILYNEIEKGVFEQLGNSYIKRYSNDELDNMYKYWKSEFEWKTSQLQMRRPKSFNFNENSMNVFEALIAFDFAVLIEENGEPLCQYMDLLRWREMIVPLEEDLFITSYFAMQDILSARVRKNFFWKPVIGHNNATLNRLVARGIAENHSHLKGAAPVFHLSWINLMNYVDKPEFRKGLQKLEQNMLQKNVAYFSGYKEESLVVMWWQAALIRVGLFIYYKVKSEEEKKGVIELVLESLKDSEKLKDNVCEIQKLITHACELSKYSEYDYAISEKWLCNNENSHLNEKFSGERHFMYRMFYEIYQSQGKYDIKFQLFYAYIVIKERIRGELIQSNYLVGFDNFKRFQDRKDVFIENTKLEPIYIEMAIRDTILNQHIVSLESRIAPKNTKKKLYYKIKEYDEWSTRNCTVEQAEKIKKKHFYVIHFIKEPERQIFDKELLCRHAEKRISVKKQANVIARLREEAWDVGCRIKGIDASSSEISCRPEVFAQAFRFLKNHMPEEAYQGSAEKYFNLRATYHVGEDFLDIVDGLRAIDEAIHYLNLRCGDRLGHALALGVDVDEWYESKSSLILISKQCYLDNIVWLYSKLRKYNIQGFDDVKSYLEKKFDELFHEVYSQNIYYEDYRDIVKNAIMFYESIGLKNGYHSLSLDFTIQEYYDSWKLRGDDPDLYKKGFFYINSLETEEWDKYAINISFPQNYKIRYNSKIALLNHMYHFNAGVKEVGENVIEVRINTTVIKAIKAVRYMMCEEISRIGLGIETNPSSNCMIGTFERYDKHPIIQWYNNGLIKNEQKIYDCPQIPVSINTDDQGVFATYIENEYAYMALALEKAKDKDGNRLYKREFIIEWLNRIRQMGIDQSFNDMD